jgi:hypothetical protein
MMLIDKILNNIFNFFENLNHKEIIKLIIIILSTIILISGFLIYRYYSNTNSLLKQINYNNVMRSETKELLTRNLAVKQQQEKVDEILTKDKTFKLMQYFDELAQELRLTHYVKNKQINISDIDSKQDYNEVTLSVNINNINMKQLTDLLLKIENNERVFIKKLEITKSDKLPVIDVNIMIATLQSKTE